MDLISAGVRRYFGATETRGTAAKARRLHETRQSTIGPNSDIRPYAMRMAGNGPIADSLLSATNFEKRPLLCAVTRKPINAENSLNKLQIAFSVGCAARWLTNRIHRGDCRGTEPASLTDLQRTADSKPS